MTMYLLPFPNDHVPPPLPKWPCHSQWTVTNNVLIDAHCLQCSTVYLQHRNSVHMIYLTHYSRTCCNRILPCDITAHVEKTGWMEFLCYCATDSNTSTMVTCCVVSSYYALNLRNRVTKVPPWKYGKWAVVVTCTLLVIPVNTDDTKVGPCPMTCSREVLMTTNPPSKSMQALSIR